MIARYHCRLSAGYYRGMTPVWSAMIDGTLCRRVTAAMAACPAATNSASGPCVTHV